jgi:hypothetical protein
MHGEGHVFTAARRAPFLHGEDAEDAARRAPFLHGENGGNGERQRRMMNVESVFVPALRLGGDYAGLAQGTEER